MESTSEQNGLHYIQIAKLFDIQGHPVSIEPFGSGHINDTFAVGTVSAASPDYLLQRINHHVFKDMEVLMENIRAVTDHLRSKYAQLGYADSEKSVLTLIRTHQDGLYHRDEQGSYWRMYTLIAGTKSYDVLETQQQAREGGRAFGSFQALLSDMDVDTIRETIPNFCHIGYRLGDFHKAMERNVADRRNQVSWEIDFIRKREAKMNTILDMAAQGDLPLRITHNDTKFNNVLLDQEDRAQCVIDLDTVMPGYVAYDFGDAIRTIINKAAEDEPDLDKIKLNVPLFEAYTQGYFEEAHGFLTKKEVESLIEGVLLFPYMQAVRFLTDYLDGDTYYKIQHPEHNLQRTRAQIKLLQEIEKQADELKRIIQATAALYPLKKVS